MGNQLFQYAASSTALFDAFKSGKLYYVSSPLSLMGRELGIKNIHIEHLRLYSNFMINYLLVPILLKFHYLFTWKIPFTNYSILSREKNIYFDEDIFKRNAIFYTGYFQSEKYFINHKNRMINEIILSRNNSKEVIFYEKLINSTAFSVSLHVRRGDYISNKNAKATHGFCGLEFYQKSVNYIKKKHKDNINFFVFSDDIEWCKSSFKDDDFTYINSSIILDTDEIYLMSICNHNVISNSSFSWWGAWLNTYNKKIVIAPEKWFVDENTQKNAYDIVPKEWLRL